MQFIEGILKIANLFLIVVAGGIAISMFKASGKNEYLKPWRMLIIALLLFVVQQVLGALRAFAIWESPFLTHINVTIILGLILYTLVQMYYVDEVKMVKD